MEAYTPFPVDGVAEALGFHRNRIPRAVFIGGLLGGIGGFFMQWFSAVVHYPLNIGGRPFNSWPAFIPITFELTVLSAAIHGRAGDARAQWSAAAPSSGLQRAELRPGVAQPVFPLPASARPLVRARQRAAFSGRASAQDDLRGSRLK